MGKAKGSQVAPAPKQNSKAQSHLDAAHSPALTLHALADKILEWHPDMDGAGDALLTLDQLHGMLMMM